MISAPKMIILLTALTVAACSTPNEPAEPAEPTTTTTTASPHAYTVPENLLNSTMVWSAEPGIDLFSEEATLARAAIEANEIALANPVSDSYPGFARAIDQETKDQYEDPSAVVTRHVGTAYFHIMHIEPTDTGFIAHTCHQTSNVAAKHSNGRYSRSVTTGDFNLRFVFERTTTDTAPAASQTPEPTSTPPVDSTGQPQWQAPTYDVFTGWNINIDGSSGRDHTQACRQWGHQYAPEAIGNEYFILTSDTPPDTLPAYPGW